MDPLTIQQAFALALRHHQAGRLKEAEQLYRQILSQQPDHAGALHLLGVIAAQVGRHDAAVTLIRQALARQPNWPEAHNNLGNAFKNMGRVDEALAAYRQALALNPRYAEAHFNFANALQSQGHLDQASAAYRRAITVKPNYAAAYYNLGNALRDQGQLDQAAAAYRQAIALQPNDADACGNLGGVLQAMGNLDAAIAAYRQTIALRPTYAEAHYNLGNALGDHGQRDDAIAAYRQAIALNPNFAAAYGNLANALRDNGCLDQAIAACRQALALKPNFPEAYNNLGNALKDKGRLDEAIAAYRQALVLNPHFPHAHSNLGNVLRDTGQLDEAVAACRQAIALKPDYAKAHNNLGNALKEMGQLDQAVAAYRQAVVLQPNFAEAHSNVLYTQLFDPAYDARAICREHQRWNQQHAEPLRKLIQPHANDRDPNRRLRIGYVSPDLSGQPVGRFMLPLLAHHDHQCFEIFAYAQVPVPDAITAQLRAGTDGWRSLVGLTDSQVCDLVRRDRIDILVDLTLHMANHRLLVFAGKPAPVQATYLAYAGTSGLTTMDYRLSDPWLDPPGMDETIYSEQTIRLADTYWCYQPVVDLPLQPPPALANGFVTFGCLNNFCKVNEPLLSLWAKMLMAVPQSQLLLHAREGSHRQRVLDYLQRQGIDPARVSFAGMGLPATYFQRYQAIDIALDTHPYGGGTTSCDALWMGVPLVTWIGPTAVGRGGLSILANLSLPELAAQSPEDYVQIAVGLASDWPRLQALHATLRQRMLSSVLMDAPRFARNMEAAYRQMWRRYCAPEAAN